MEMLTCDAPWRGVIVFYVSSMLDNNKLFSLKGFFGLSLKRRDWAQQFLDGS